MDQNSKSTLVDIVIRKVNTLVHEGRFKEGDKLPSNTELAEMMDVSTLTIHRAMKQLEARGVLLSRRRHGKFLIHPERLETPQIQSDMVGFFLPDLSLDFMLEMLYSLEFRLSNAGKMLSVNLTHTQPEKEIRLLSGLMRNQLEALVYATSPYTAMSEKNSREVSKWVERYTREGTFVLFMDLCPIGMEDRLISLDNVKAGRMLTESLIAKGHKKIAYLGCDDHISGCERRQGYEEALREAGLEVRPENFISCDMTGEKLPGDFRKFHRAYPEVSGFVSYTQAAGKAVCQVLDESKTDRNSGVDCLASFFEDYEPPFEAVATIHIPGAEMGEVASEILSRVRSSEEVPGRRFIEPKLWIKKD